MKHRLIMAMFIGILTIAWLTTPVIAASLSVPNPTVTGPIPVLDVPGTPTHNYPFFTPTANLADYGYVEEEFFIQGFAKRYSSSGGLITPDDYPYKTRIIVRRPISPKKFNGVVLLEWQNVTAGYDLDAMWSMTHFTRSGYAWVGVSAQRVGVHGGSSLPNQGLKTWSPIRYGTLDVTAGGSVMDDSLCYDIYSQVIQAIKNPEGIDPMNGFGVKMILAIGASQSASRLVTYHNSIHPLHWLADGFFLLVGGYGTRTDLDVKVFQVVSETDVGFYARYRIPDSERRRYWEVAGAAHSGYWSSVYRAPLVARDKIVASTVDCTSPPLTRTHFEYVINAAYDHMVQWIAKGTPPPTAPLIEMVSINPNVILRDSLGLALGGIQLPSMVVPTALNNGTNGGSGFCVLYGTYIPFNDSTLNALYRNHGTYVSAVTQATNYNLKAGYIINADAQTIRDEAAHSNIPPK
jgi:hypothetical protein